MIIRTRAGRPVAREMYKADIGQCALSTRSMPCASSIEFDPNVWCVAATATQSSGFGESAMYVCVCCIDIWLHLQYIPNVKRSNLNGEFIHCCNISVKCERYSTWMKHSLVFWICHITATDRSVQAEHQKHFEEKTNIWYFCRSLKSEWVSWYVTWVPWQSGDDKRLDSY